MKEGKLPDTIHFVGHVMIDNLLYQAQQLQTYDCTQFPTYTLKGNTNGYIFLTLHRPSNVDSKQTFDGIAKALNSIAEEKPIFFPVHPRTKKMMEQFDIKFCLIANG